jgi:paraquat-inducible protein B
LAPTNHWKLGLFVVSAFALGLLTLVILGSQSLQKQTTSYKTYFDESVQGLEVGSPVKFRGVTLGNVSRIDIAADHRLVEVTSELQVKEIRRLRLSTELGKRPRINLSSDLRMQLDSAGITGVKYLLLDFFPEADNPLPPLPFPPPENYIPAAVSMIKNLQASVVRSLNRLPEVTEALLLVLGKIDRFVAQFEKRQLPVRAEAAMIKAERVLDSADGLLRAAHGTLRGLQTKELSTQAQRTLASIETTTTRLNGLVDKLSGDEGVATNLQRATESVAEVAHGASGATEELEQTLRAVREAASSIQKLAEALETDSDMLLKGRTRSAR